MNALNPTTSSSTSSKIVGSIKPGGRECGVCGKPATGKHYLAVTCNGCRSFFRRCIADNKLYECKRAGETQIQCFQQYDCKKCRLELCLAAGMNPHGVKNEGDLNETMNIPDDIQTIVHQPSQIELRLDKMIRDLLAIEDAHQQLRISTYCPRLTEGLTVDEFAFKPSKLGFNYGVMRAQCYEPISIQFVPPEIFVKQKVILDFSNFDYSSKKLWLFQDVVYSMEFMKALPIYHLLDDSSKVVLLSSALHCSNLTTAFFSYSHHSDRTYYPDGGTMSWSAEIEAKSPDSTRFHTKTIAAIREANLDKREYALLKMILLCNPMLNGLSPHDVTLIQREKERWTKTLLSYVLSRRGTREGPSIFAKILAIADLVWQLTAWAKGQHILGLAMGIWKHRIPFVESVFHSS